MSAKLRVHRAKVLSFAATSAGALLSAVSPAAAAPATYQTSVLANNPYVFYRQQENGITTGTVAEDTSINNRDGIYQGTPTGGQIGVGEAGSDTAVSYANSSYLTSPISTFGGSVPTSSYEFVFKADTPDFTQAATLFGLINADLDGAGGRTGNQAVAVEVNAAGVNGTTSAGTSRIWLRDEDGSQLWANISHGNLLDGSYHHFAATVDLSAPTAADKVKMYIDGVPVAITGAAESAALADNWQSFTVDGGLAARIVRNTGVDRFAPITVDEFALYGTTLTPAQVAANASAAGIPEPGGLALVALAGLGMIRRARRA